MMAAIPSRPHGVNRFWWILPMGLTFAVDVILTLLGQPDRYWEGHRDDAVEANPLACGLLLVSPWLFLGLATAWVLVLGLIVKTWTPRFAVWLPAAIVVINTLAHAIGGGSWLMRHGTWGWIAMIVYLAPVAEFTKWCFRRNVTCGGSRLATDHRDH